MHLTRAYRWVSPHNSSVHITYSPSLEDSQLSFPCWISLGRKQTWLCGIEFIEESYEEGVLTPVIATGEDVSVWVRDVKYTSSGEGSWGWVATGAAPVWVMVRTLKGFSTFHQKASLRHKISVWATASGRMCFRTGWFPFRKYVWGWAKDQMPLCLGPVGFRNCGMPWTIKDEQPQVVMAKCSIVLYQSPHENSCSRKSTGV